MPLAVFLFSYPLLIIGLVLLLALVSAFSVYVSIQLKRRIKTLELVVEKKSEDLMAERERREAMLGSFLPKNTADEILTKGKANKIKYNFVTVLFSDIQGFTQIAEEMNPEVLIDELDKFFFHFDSVAEKYGIEKIKTIGDAYMCAGGLPEKNRTNPVEVILAAIEMQAYMLSMKGTNDLHGMKFWDIRIGIHTGTVVAGVIGQKKLSFDIWGDTVNTASRMESSGDAGKINISGTTYEFVKDFFLCEYRGKMPVKYKGELEMYFVKGIIPELCHADGNPNERFLTKLRMLRVQDLEEIILKMFDEDAPPNLYFHSASLVRNICSQVDLLSNAVQLPDEDFVNLKLASAFLLSGYITDYENPMDASLILAERRLPGYGFSKENIAEAKRLIVNSFINRRETLSDDILHDARYDYLGRIDYLKLADKEYRELSENGFQCDKKAWIEIQKKVFDEHEFATDAAKLLRSVTVEEQLKALSTYAD
jgi:adenylate cyclase